MRTFFLLALLFLYGCNRQQENTIPINEKVTSKKFNLDSFKKKAKLKKIIRDAKFVYIGECEFIENDSIYKWEEQEKVFYEEVKNINGKFKRVSNYNKETLLISSGATFFYRIPIGITRLYNQKGQLIKEINNDENYPFSIFELIIKLRATHNINLDGGQQVGGVDRYFEKSFNRYIYSINYKNAIDNQLKYIVVDAKNGKILKEGILTLII